MPQSGVDSAIVLGGCIFDAARGTLLRDGAPVYLRPKPFALLSLLADNAGEVVSKSDLLTRIWPGVFVTEDSLTHAVREVRKALGDEDQAILKTVPKRGYLLVVPARRPEPAAPRTGIAILRFQNEGLPEDGPVIDGFAEDIIGAMARFRALPVTPRQSSFSFEGGDGLDWRRIGNELAVRYLVIGRGRLHGQTLSASISLLDAVSGDLVWSDTFAATGSAIFDLQLEIARKVVNRLVARVSEAVLERAAPKPTESLAAYEFLLRGLAHLRGYGDQANRTALGYFEAALEKDGAYALALAYRALAQVLVAGYGEAPPAVRHAAIEQAERAVTLSPEEPRCQRVLANLLLQDRRYDAAEYHYGRAIDLNPYDADTLAQIGYLQAMRGRPEVALGHLQEAVKANPIHPDWYNYDLAIAYYAAERYKQSYDALARLPRRAPALLARLAAAQAMLGNREQAARLVAELKASWPNYSMLDFARRGIPFEHGADVERMVRGVELALAAHG